MDVSVIDLAGSSMFPECASSGPPAKRPRFAPAPPSEPATRPAPKPGLDQFRRPHLPEPADPRLGGITLTAFMDKESRVADVTEEQLLAVLDALEAKWILATTDVDSLHTHANAHFGIAPNIIPDPSVIFRQYRHNTYQIIRVYVHCVIKNIAGPKSEESLTNNRRFSKILEQVNAIYEWLLSEHRMKGIITGRYIQIPDEVSLFKFSCIDYSRNTPFQSLVVFMLRRAYEENLRKYGGMCYEVIDTKSGKSTHAWKQSLSIPQFIRTMCNKNTCYEQWHNLTSAAGNEKSLVTYLANCDDVEFPFLVPDRHIFSFKNGIYAANVGGHGGTFYDYDNDDISNKIVSCKYFNIDFDYTIFETYESEWYDISTPAIQSIMDMQEWPVDVCKIMYAMMGRCLYNVGELDMWQIIPFVKGVAGSGKSTMGRAVANFYSKTDVGVLSNNIEAKFGISQLANKLLVMAYEIKSNFGLDQADVQTMISGEEMSMPVKNQDALVKYWTAPCMFFGNESGGWVDAAGSMTRRLASFEANKIITAVNPNLPTEIAEQMAPFLYKCNYAYRELAALTKVKNQGIWEVLPAYFKEAQAKMARNINPLRSFIDEYDVLEKRPTHYMPYEDFCMAHNEYGKNHGFKKVKFNPDYYSTTFELCGITVATNERKMWQGKTIIGNWVCGIGPRDMLEPGGAAGSPHGAPSRP